jgi:hypothetical protein
MKTDSKVKVATGIMSQTNEKSSLVIQDGAYKRCPFLMSMSKIILFLNKVTCYITFEKLFCFSLKKKKDILRSFDQPVGLQLSCDYSCCC